MSRQSDTSTVTTALVPADSTREDADEEIRSRFRGSSPGPSGTYGLAEVALEPTDDSNEKY